jgi:hypothetical protein
MLAIILVVLAFVAIAGVGIYYYIDMKDHKATNSTDFDKVTKKIDEEKNTRLGNIKYVVDQVNTTNEAMDKEYGGKIAALEKADTGFGKLIKTGPDGAPTEIKDTPNPENINLMKHVSMIGGMSIKDLQQIASATLPAKTFKACGTGPNKKCIEFPNSNGDTYLTALNGTGKAVVSGSVFKAKEGLKTDTINNLTTGSNLTISTGATSNIITVSNTTANGIKIASGNSFIDIINGTINIQAPVNNNTSMPQIQINGQKIGSTTVATPAGALPLTLKQLTTAFKGKKVLTIEQ